MDELYILKLELSGIKNSVMHAMIQRREELESMVQKEMDTILTPEYLSTIIAKETKICVSLAIKNSIKNYFSFGDGHDQIQKMVELTFNKGETNEKKV